MFATNHETFKQTIFSHKTTPDLKLVEGLYMSCSVPFLFKPIKYNNIFHVDGIYTSRFPINNILKNNPDINRDEVFGMYIKSKKELEKKRIYRIILFHFILILLQNYYYYTMKKIITV